MGSQPPGDPNIHFLEMELNQLKANFKDDANLIVSFSVIWNPSYLCLWAVKITLWMWNGFLKGMLNQCGVKVLKQLKKNLNFESSIDAVHYLIDSIYRCEPHSYRAFETQRIGQNYLADVLQYGVQVAGNLQQVRNEWTHFGKGLHW